MYLWAAVQHTIEQPALSEGSHMAESVNNWYVQLLLHQLTAFFYQHLLGNNDDSALQANVRRLKFGRLFWV